MTRPPNHSDSNSDKELERASEMLERYLLERDEFANDRELLDFKGKNSNLIRAAEELRSSWHRSFEERVVNVPPLNMEIRSESVSRTIAVNEESVSATGRSSGLSKDGFSNKDGLPNSVLPQRRSRGFFSNARNLSLSLGAIAITVTAGLWLSDNNPFSTNSASYQVSGNESYITKRGERTRVQLIDGSTVILAPESRLTLSPGGNSIRDVTLEGEGYFAVKGNPEDPFIVRSGTGVVRVLGTEFSVRNYPTDENVRVSVASGRVSFSTSDNNEKSEGKGSAQLRRSENAHYVILNAFDVAHLDPENNLKIIRNVNIDNYISWRKGELRFDDVSTSELLAEVGRAYDLNFVVSPQDSSLMQLRVSATLMETSTDGIVEVVSMLLNVDAHRKGRTVSLVKRSSAK